MAHPREWLHCAYREFAGERLRCRIVNWRLLLDCLAMDDEEQFCNWHMNTLEDKLLSQELAPEPYWSMALAVGDAGWLKEAAVNSGMRRVKIAEAGRNNYLIGRAAGGVAFA